MHRSARSASTRFFVLIARNCSYRHCYRSCLTWNDERQLHRVAWFSFSSSSSSFTSSTVTVAELGLDHWLQRIQDMKESVNDKSVKGVIHSFQKLDLLVQEGQATIVNQPQFSVDVLPLLVLESDILNQIVYNWSGCLVKQEDTNFHHEHHRLSGDQQDGLLLPQPEQLVQLLDEYQERLPCLRPNSKTYSMILHVIAKQQQKRRQRPSSIFSDSIAPRVVKETTSTIPTTTDGIHLANTLLHRMIGSDDEDLIPEIVVFNTVLDTLAQTATPAAAQVAEDTLQMLLDHYLEHRTPLLSSSSSQNLVLQPDVVTFNTVMSAWAKAFMPERAEQVFHNMQHLHQTYGYTWAKPTVQTYGTLIAAWGRLGQHKQAQMYFDEMMSRFPTTPSGSNSSTTELPQVEQYNALLHAWAVAGYPGHCEALLLKMMKMAEAITHGGETETSRPSSSSPNRKEERENHQPSHHVVYPNTTSFTIVLDAYAKSTSDPEAAERAQDLFFQILHYHSHHHNPSSSSHSRRPHPAVYRAMMNVWNKHARFHPPNAALNKAMEIFQAMPKSGLLVEDLNVLFQAMAKAGQGTLALKWLHNHLPKFGIAPDITTYSTILSAIAMELRHLNQHHRQQQQQSNKGRDQQPQQTQPNTDDRQNYLAQQAERLWNEMESRGIQPNARLLAALASVHVQCSDIDANAAAKAQVVLEQIIHHVLTATTMESSSSMLLKSAEHVEELVLQVLDAWIQQGDCNQAEMFWWQLHDQAKNMSNSNTMNVSFVSLKSLNLILEGWSRLAREDPSAAERAELLLRRVEEEFVGADPTSSSTIRPDGKSHREVMAAWAEHANELAKVEELWQERVTRLLAGEMQLGFTTADYNVMMSAVLKFGKHDLVKELFHQLDSASSSSPQPPGEEQSVGPNATSFAILIDSECRRESVVDSGPVQAHALFHQMMQRYIGGDASCQPNPRIFRALTAAWIKSKNPEKHVMADNLLGERIQRYVDGDAACRPQYQDYHVVIETCVKAGDVPRAELRLLEICGGPSTNHLRPNNIAFNIVLSGWAKSKFDGAAEHAEKLLRYMEQADDVGCRPCAVSYTSVINAWSNSRRPDALERISVLLDDMSKQKQQDGTAAATPDCFTYSAVVRAIARSHATDKIERVKSILRQLAEQGLEPNSHIVEGILLACSVTRCKNLEERHATFALARDMLQRVLQQPNSIRPVPNMMLFFLKTCVFVAEPSQATTQAASEAFEICRRHGFDSDPRIVKAFQQATRPRRH